MANDAGPEAKQWGLAATAILTTLTRREPRHDLLGGAPKSPESEANAKTMLASSWNVDGRDKLVSTLEWLGGGGHSQEYQKAAAAFPQAPPQAQQQDPRLALVGQFGAEIGNRGLLAWDLGRMLALAGWGYLAGYCSEDEAWGAIFSAGIRLRGTYASWEEYGKHYRFGAMFTDPNSAQQIDAIVGQLVSAPNSPWRAVAWRLDGPPVAPAYGAPPGGGGFPAPAGGTAPSAGAAPAPAVSGGVPVVAPPPGSPGAPTSYGGVPVIAPPPGGAAPPPGALVGPGGAPGGNKKAMLFAIAGGGFFLLLVLIGLIWHFTHRASHEPPREPASHEEHGRHGRH